MARHFDDEDEAATCWKCGREMDADDGEVCCRCVEDEIERQEWLDADLEEDCD